MVGSFSKLSLGFFGALFPYPWHIKDKQIRWVCFCCNLFNLFS